MEQLSELSQAPKEVTLGASCLTMVGQRELTIENHRGILEYSDTNLRIRVRSGLIRVSGAGLLIEYYSKEEIRISGRMKSIEYNG